MLHWKHLSCFNISFSLSSASSCLCFTRSLQAWVVILTFFVDSVSWPIAKGGHGEADADIRINNDWFFSMGRASSSLPLMDAQLVWITVPDVMVEALHTDLCWLITWHVLEKEETGWALRFQYFSLWTALCCGNSARNSFTCNENCSSHPELLMAGFLCAVNMQVPCLDAAGQWNWREKWILHLILTDLMLYLVPGTRACVNCAMLNIWPILYLVFHSILFIPLSSHQLESHNRWDQSSPVCDPVCAWLPGSTAEWSASSFPEMEDRERWKLIIGKDSMEVRGVLWV